MKNADENVAVMQNQTNFLLHDLWSQGYGRPKDDTERNGTYDLTNIVYTPKDIHHKNSTYLIKYRRKFDTGDPNDFSIDYVRIIIITKGYKYHYKHCLEQPN